MQLNYAKIEAGLPSEVKILHISDTHFCLADERDCRKKRDMAEKRTQYHLDIASKPLPSVEAERERVENTLDELLQYGFSHCDQVVHTGDFYDIVTEANIDMLASKLSDGRVLYTPGSHEFTQYLYERFDENDEYKALSLDKVRHASPNPLEFAVKWVKGLRLIALDNSFYKFNARQFEALKNELAERMAPTLLLMHTPLYCPAVFHEWHDVRKKNPADIIGLPKSVLNGLDMAVPSCQLPNEVTLMLCDFIRSQPQIKGILAGHLHFFWQGEFAPGQTQILTGLGNDGCAVEVTVK